MKGAEDRESPQHITSSITKTAVPSGPEKKSVAGSRSHTKGSSPKPAGGPSPKPVSAGRSESSHSPVRAPALAATRRMPPTSDNHRDAQAVEPRSASSAHSHVIPLAAGPVGILMKRSREEPSGGKMGRGGEATPPFPGARPRVGSRPESRLRPRLGARPDLGPAHMSAPPPRRLGGKAGGFADSFLHSFADFVSLLSKCTSSVPLSS